MSMLSFVQQTVPLSLAALAAAAAAPAPEARDATRLFRAVATLDRAGPDAVTAFVDGDDLDDLSTTRAGACCLGARHVAHLPPHTIALVSDDPLVALGRIAAAIHPRGHTAALAFDPAGIDRAAIVHRDAALEQGVVLDPCVVVGPGAEIGAATTIGANTVVGAGVRIGRGCAIDAHVSLGNALIGDRVAIHAGARIGLGGSGGRPSIGRVIIQDGATIGANAVVERGSVGDTTIGEQARIGALAFVPADTHVGRGETRGDARFPSCEEMV